MPFREQKAQFFIRMKKAMVMIAGLAILGMKVNAQELTWGVRAGMNISSTHMKSGGFTENSDSKIGFHVGAVLDWQILDMLYIQPGLQYSLKGMKWDDADAKSNASYIELPILASYRLYLGGENTRLHINAGPYLAMGIAGKSKDTDTGEKWDTFGDEGLKRFDVGLQFGAGVSFSKFYVGGSYQLGLMNIGRDDIKYKNRNWMITLGYTF